MAARRAGGSVRRSKRPRNQGMNAPCAAKSAGGKRPGKSGGKTGERGINNAQKAESPRNGGLSVSLLVASFATTAQRSMKRTSYPLIPRSLKPYAKFFAAKSQFTMFQYASTNFGRALR